MGEVPVLLLAAGGSERMGQAKQLLPWGNTTLIEHQIQVLLKTENPVLTVLGSQTESILPVVKNLPVDTAVNQDWEKGMGSSISLGVKRVMKAYPGAEGILIALVDLPRVPVEHYMHMLKAFQPGIESILVSRSESGVEGVPALFDSVYFRELSALEGERGAKKIIQRHRKRVLCLECDEIMDDLDTPDDYRRLHAIYMKSIQ